MSGEATVEKLKSEVRELREQLRELQHRVGALERVGRRREEREELRK